MNWNWNNIRLLGNSQNDGFEELVCQLARREDVPDRNKFIRKGKPDAGVECYWILDNQDEWAWQAKYFTASLTATQWKELDDSVKTALEKHPKLKKYFVALPIDPPDARETKKKSMLNVWNDRVTKWGQWAKDKSIEVIFEAWWGSDLIFRLQKPENVGLTYFWFNKEEFTDAWCKEQTELSIVELGKRYTPELNMELDVSKIFDGIARDEKFEEHIKVVFDDFFIKAKKIHISDEKVKDETVDFQNKIRELYELFSSSEFYGVSKIPYTAFDTLLDSISKINENLTLYFSNLEKEIQDEKKQHSYYEKYGSEIHSLREFSYSLDRISSFIASPLAKLSNNPVLLLDGEAGIGKSHLIADVVSKRNAEGKPSLLLLGQHFVTDEDPWTQIFKRLGARCSLDEFLGALNSKAEIGGSRFILFIDAMNEGRGKYFWGNNVKSFIKKISKYEWLGLVVSIRTSYKKLIFPSDEWLSQTVVCYTHYGFREVEYEATKLFFGANGIQLPNIPLLHPEFQNPLFLKLFCEGLRKSGRSKIPDGLQGITAIIDFFIESVNAQLSKPERLEYPETINVVRKAIDVLILEKIGKKFRYIPYETAFVLADTIITAYSAKRGLLEELISEGVLSKNLFWKSDSEYEEGVYLAYERFEDHLTASFLLEKSPNIEQSFSENGDLHYLAKDERACHFNKGLIEAFSVQLPEKLGKEFYEVVPHVKNLYPVAESFVQSLLWRKINTISEKLIDYINTCVLRYNGTHDLFWGTLLSVTSIPGHYFNAYSLHRHLSKYSLPDRDAWWNKYLKSQFYDETAVMRLIDWGCSKDTKDHISDESIKLSSIALAWFLASTNRRLRDTSTKALISLLENRIPILIEVMKTFDGVNDPYVYERLFAVAYGCAIRTKQFDALSSLSLYVFETIFNKDGEIYPHILLRDYARGVIEFSAYKGLNDAKIDIGKARPPYKSSLPKQFPSNEEIDGKYEFNYESKDFKDYYWGQNNILSSMTTEYGRGTAGYGDFGRYVFQSALENWDVNPDQLSNLCVEWIFEKYGYDVEKHGQFDRQIGSGRGRGAYPHERIGKKYQWLVFYEMLARVSDNCKKYSERGRKKFEPFEGAWEPYVRDIDPTVLIKNTGKNLKPDHAHQWWSQKDYANWAMPHKDWIAQTKDLPDLQGFLSVADSDNITWLVLEGHPEWTEPKPLGVEEWSIPHKRLWYYIRSYLIRSKDFEKIRSWAARQSFAGMEMPQSHDTYQLFNREYYWSPAFRYFQTDYYNGVHWKKVKDQRRDKTIAEVMVTSESYHWEEEYDASKESTLHLLKPCVELYEKLDMAYSDQEGEFVDKEGALVCFDPAASHQSNSFLLVRKDAFVKYLQENDLKILWTVFGEKNIIGGWLNSKAEYTGRQLINGVYYLTDAGVMGNVSSKID